jgi:hypothetical protein
MYMGNNLWNLQLPQKNWTAVIANQLRHNFSVSSRFHLVSRSDNSSKGLSLKNTHTYLCYKQQDRQCTYTIILRCVRVTIVARTYVQFSWPHHFSLITVLLTEMTQKVWLQLCRTEKKQNIFHCMQYTLMGINCFPFGHMNTHYNFNLQDCYHYT